MTKRVSSRLISNTCSFCGKTFYSAQKAQFCIDKSTCRVKAKQLKDKSQKAAKQLMMDFEAYEVYKAFVETYPSLKEQTDHVFFDYGKDAMVATIALVNDAIIKINAITP